MKERPILFSDPMVRAIIDGRKTQTRRVAPITDLNIKQHSDDMVTWGVSFSKPVKGVLGSYSGGRLSDEQARRIIASMFCPYGQPGDRLWVREAWQYYDWNEDGEPCLRFAADNATTWPWPSDDWSERIVDIWEVLSRDENFNIDNRARDRRWRPSIHMPRWASRINLDITGVRVERLQDISEDDCWAEGIESVDGIFDDQIHAIAKRIGCCAEDAKPTYGALWESINGDGSWEANPWVWVVEFKRVEGGEV